MGTRAVLDLAVSTILGLCALTITGLVVRRELFSPRLNQAVTQPRFINNAPDYGKTGHVLGVDADHMRMVEFSDYQCPFCKDFEKTLTAARDTLGGHLVVIYRHFPLEQIHPEARSAALAAECAGEQGRYADFHRALLEDPVSFSREEYIRLSQHVGIADSTQFAQCIAAQRYQDRIDADIAAGKALGIHGTPSVLIGDTLYSGVMSLNELLGRLRRSAGQ